MRRSDRVCFFAALLCAGIWEQNADACGVTNVNPSAHGTVIVHPRVRLVLWGLNSTNDPQNVIPVMQNFLKSIGGTKYLGTVSQYTAKNGTEHPFMDRGMWVSTWTDPLPPPGPKFPTNSQIQAEV